ncbi:MAG: xanthine dehydrogenase family protein molybdopterin-binding subunit [bacterium]
MKATPSDFRIDAADKIAGRTRYIRDEQIPGLWYGGTIRSPHPHAKILSVHFFPEFDWKQVVAATAADIPNNYVAMLEQDMPFLAETIANYVGEPVVVVAAPDPALLQQALQCVQVDYEPLPALLDLQKAVDSDVRIFGDRNLFKDILIEKGDLEAAKRRADAVVQIESRAGFQEHLYLEPQGIVAIPNGNRIVIRGSLQCPYYVKGALETMFAGRKEITVVQSPTGGAFGGKEDFPSLIAGHAALLAEKCKHPVAFFYDREEDVKFSTKRHPLYYRGVAYVATNGRLLGLDVYILLDGGAYCTLSQVVLSRAALTAMGCYYTPNVRIHAQAVATNKPPSGAFRGFGGPQAILGIELLMEKIARTLKLTPDAVRRTNLIQLGQTTSTGQVLKYSVSAQETYEDALKRAEYQRKYAEYKAQNEPILQRLRKGEYPKKRPEDLLKGIGISAFQHGAGFTGTGENRIKGRVRIALDGNGDVAIYAASTEMGQGKETAFRIILSETLKIAPEQVIVAPVDTDFVPDSGPTVASRTTMIVGSLLVEAGQELICLLGNRLKRDRGADFDYRSGHFYSGEQTVSFTEAARQNSDITVEKAYHHPPLIRFDDVHWKGDAYPVYSWAAAVAEVEVDPITFETRVTRYTTTHEIGKAINYNQAEAQIQGGSLQGIGYALYEYAKLTQGSFENSGFTDYIIPTTVETPQFDVKILENPYPFGPLGAKGLGELPFVGAAPAVLSALWMIFDLEFTEIPVLPEEMQERMKRKD